MKMMVNDVIQIMMNSIIKVMLGVVMRMLVNSIMNKMVEIVMKVMVNTDMREDLDVQTLSEEIFQDWGNLLFILPRFSPLYRVVSCGNFIQ